MELEKGMLAISKAGHDKDCWYVVQKVEDNFVYLVNGETKKVDAPKKKKRKHLQPVNEIPELLAVKLQNQVPWTNEEIKRALKLAKRIDF